jgi:5,10-methylenetetrahydromethanopterin reductase
VPIYVGATGMQMMALAGEVADGVVLNYLVSPDYNRRALDALAEGAARAGRTIADVDRPQLVVCSLSADRAAALDAARLLVTQYLGQQPHIMKAAGVPDDLLAAIGRTLTWPASHEDVLAAAPLVGDDVVQLLCAAGTAEECRAKVAEYVAAGCTSPILYPLGDVDATLEAFAPVPPAG